jgi:hypothetical protein
MVLFEVFVWIGSFWPILSLCGVKSFANYLIDRRDNACAFAGWAGLHVIALFEYSYEGCATPGAFTDLTLDFVSGMNATAVWICFSR